MSGQMCCRNKGRGRGATSKISCEVLQKQLNECIKYVIKVDFRCCFFQAVKCFGLELVSRI